MIAKTTGIVIRRIKYNDKSNIITLLTENFGKKSFILFGINSKNKGKFLRAAVQPMNILNIEFYYKETQTLGKIKELSIAYPYYSIPQNVFKKTITLFLSEIIDKITIEHLQDKQLFNFILNSLKLLDLTPKNYSNFHLFFLCELTKFLGIEPINNFSDKNQFFNIQEAKFTPDFNPTLSMNKNLSQLLNSILNLGITNMDKIKLSRSDRNQLLQHLLNFYAYHIDSFSEIKSFEILKQIFNSF